MKYIAHERCNKIYKDLCDCEPGNCLNHYDLKLLDEVIGNKDDWIRDKKFQRVSGINILPDIDIRHCICKCRIKDVFKIINKNGDEAYLGSKCILRIDPEPGIDFNFYKDMTEQKGMFVEDTKKCEYQDRDIFTIKKLCKEYYNINITGSVKNYNICRPFVINYITNEKPLEEINRLIEFNRFLYKNMKRNTRSIKYIRNNSKITPNKPILDSLLIYPEIMCDFIHITGSGKKKTFKDVYEWDIEYKQWVCKKNMLFEIYNNHLNKEN